MFLIALSDIMSIEYRWIFCQFDSPQNREKHREPHSSVLLVLNELLNPLHMLNIFSSGK